MNTLLIRVKAIIEPRHTGEGRYLIIEAGSLKDPGLRRDDRSLFIECHALRVRKDFVIASTSESFGFHQVLPTLRSRSEAIT